MRLFLSLSSHCYLFTALLYLAFFLKQRRWLARLALGTLAAGVLCQAVWLGATFGREGALPLLRLDEGLAFFGWLLAAGLLVVEWRYRVASIGVFVAPLVAAAVLPAVLLRLSPEPLPEALRRAGMPAHIVVSFAGIAMLALAAAVAGAFLLLEWQMKSKRFGLLFSRLPSLQLLDELGSRLTRGAFVALTLTLLSGAWFAKQVWGDYWRWDPKLILSLGGWALLAGLVQARLFGGLRGRRAAVLTMLGFLVLFGSYVGLKLYPVGLHTGGYR